jgi:hypothetical protein
VSADLEPLPIVRAGDLADSGAARRWLVEGLWTRAAVGFIGGVPKLGKTWLGLDLALSVATDTPCLGRYQIAEPGETLVYLAEDHPSEVRQRLASLCRHRGLDISRVRVNVITAPTLRLDLEKDRQRLTDAVQRLSPKLVLLDPLVRLHRKNENDAAEVSELLAYLRELQRQCDVAIAVVHHMRKNGNAGDGQALRGSGDFHAWTDSALYLGRVRGELRLRVEHRAAPSPPPIALDLISEPEGGARLEVSADSGRLEAQPTPTRVLLDDRVVDLLRRSTSAMMRTEIRERLGVSNKRLGEVLTSLEAAGLVIRDEKRWALRASVPRSGFQPTPEVGGTERRNGGA